MVKRIIVASALALFSIGLAGTGGAATPRPPLPARQSPGVLTTPVLVTVQACEAQMRRMAGSVKTLAFNYNAERVHNECAASAREAVASK